MQGILRNIDTGDLQIENGTLKIGDNTEDIVETVLMSATGELKHSPKIGANLIKSVNGTPPSFFKNRIKTMLAKEHIKANKIAIENSQITVEL